MDLAISSLYVTGHHNLNNLTLLLLVLSASFHAVLCLSDTHPREEPYMGKDVEKAVTKMEQRMREKAPELKVLARGLSIQVEKWKGPIVDGELPKCKEFGTAIAAALK